MGDGTITKQKDLAYKEDYTHLLDRSEFEQRLQGRDIEAILVEVCTRDREGQQIRKWVLIDARAVNRLGHTNQSNEKSAAYLSTSGLVWSAAEVTFSIGAAFCGGQQNLPGGIFTAMGLGAQKAAHYKDQGISAKVTVIDHSYQSTGTAIQDESRFLQETDQDFKANTQTIDRIAQDIRRLIELILGGQ